MMAFSTKGYSDSFCHAVRFILIKEGALYVNGKPTPTLGYVNDPLDAGGETKGGISKRAFPHLDIATLTLDDIVRIYHTNYYRAAHCTSFSAMVGYVVFDSAVQHGVRRAIMMLQEVAGTKPDGVVGRKTLQAVNSLDQEYLTSRLILRRARFYARILKSNHSQSRFIEGWHNRLAALLEGAWELSFG